MPTRSWCSRAAPSSSVAPTLSCCSGTDATRRCTAVSCSRRSFRWTSSRTSTRSGSARSSPRTRARAGRVSRPIASAWRSSGVAHGHGGGGGGGFVHDDEILGKAYDAKLTRRLVSYLGPYKPEVALAIFLLFLMSATQILPPVLAKFIIDSAIAPAVSGEIAHEEGFARLAFLGIGYIVVLAAASGFRFWQSVLTTSIGQRAMYDLRLQLFRHLQFLSLSFFDRNPVGRLMTRITNDIDALTEMVSRCRVSIVGDHFPLVADLLVCLLLDWRRALLTFVSLPILPAITTYFRSMMCAP